MQCSMDHIVINMEDDEAMIAFYTTVLMLSPERLAAYRTGNAPFPSIRLNPNTIIDLFPKKLWQTQDIDGCLHENLNHFCLTMDQPAWEQLRQSLHANQISIEVGPVARWGAQGTGTSIYFRDPQGNLIEARYY